MASGFCHENTGPSGRNGLTGLGLRLIIVNIGTKKGLLTNN